MITCTGLWLTCFVILFLSTWLFIIPRLLSSALLLLLSKLYTILCLKDTLGFDWIFVFRRPKNLDLPHLLSLFCVLFDCDCHETVLFELMITCTGLWLTCFVILFLYSRLWVFRGCSRLACYFCLKMFQAILCLKETLGFDWIFVFRRPKNLDFLFLLSLSRVLFDCHFDETVLFELMITCTGLWLTCFVILFFVYMTFHSSAVAF